MLLIPRRDLNRMPSSARPDESYSPAEWLELPDLAVAVTLK